MNCTVTTGDVRERLMEQYRDLLEGSAGERVAVEVRDLIEASAQPTAEIINIFTSGECVQDRHVCQMVPILHMFRRLESKGHLPLITMEQLHQGYVLGAMYGLMKDGDSPPSIHEFVNSYEQAEVMWQSLTKRSHDRCVYDLMEYQARLMLGATAAAA